jgi:hypothetical protein
VLLVPVSPGERDPCGRRLGVRALLRVDPPQPRRNSCARCSASRASGRTCRSRTSARRSPSTKASSASRSSSAETTSLRALLRRRGGEARNLRERDGRAGAPHARELRRRRRVRRRRRAQGQGRGLRGVRHARHHDRGGVATIGDTRTAWLKDPDGNIPRDRGRLLRRPCVRDGCFFLAGAGGDIAIALPEHPARGVRNELAPPRFNCLARCRPGRLGAVTWTAPNARPEFALTCLRRRARGRRPRRRRCPPGRPEPAA